MVPPYTLPSMLASWGIIKCVDIRADSETFLAPRLSGKLSATISFGMSDHVLNHFCSLSDRGKKKAISLSLAQFIMDKITPVTIDEMRELENRAEQIGISKLLLMENAGSAVARFVGGVVLNSRVQIKSKGSKINVLAVAGTGNNGGDVFVASRHLAYWDSINVTLVLIGRNSVIRTEEAIRNWKILENIPKITKIEIADPSEVHSSLSEFISESNIVIVGVFGTGFRGKPRELQLSAINEINSRKKGSCFCVSVDLPSGMEADTGDCVYSVMSDATVTMHAPKVGMQLTENSRLACGELVIANIGIPFGKL